MGIMGDQITDIQNNQPPPNNPPPPSPVAQSSAPTTTLTPQGTPKFKEPTVFNGKATQVVGFLQEIRDALYLLRSTYVTDKDKCIYLATYLGEGTPKEWYKSILISDADCVYKEDELVQNFDKFTAHFKKHFGDSDLVATAHNKLDNLYQMGSVATYAARFME